MIPQRREDDIKNMDTLIQRRNWLRERVRAKEKVGWETEWDIRERDSLTWAIRILRKYLGKY